MELFSLFGHTSELYRIINKSPQPPDNLTREYLKSKKYLGSHDRKFISSVLFTILRIKSMPEYFLGFDIVKHFTDRYISDPKEQEKFTSILNISLGIIIANILNIEFKEIDILPDNDYLPFVDATALTISKKYNIEQEEVLQLLNTLISFVKNFISDVRKIDINKEITSDELKALSIRYAQQEWVFKLLLDSSKYSPAQLIELFESLFYPATLTLRINAPSERHRAILDECKKTDPKAELSRFSPFGIYLSKRLDLNTFPLYKQGLVEIQDEGSQLITIALKPEENDTILDACAGAGGKTLHIASMTNNNSRIIASDVELRKLKELNKRTRHAHFTSVTTYLPKHLNKSGIKQYDKVLIDSPCSGMGTVRRNPMLKWRLNPSLLEKYNRKQYKILKLYAEYVKPGGVLLYSTCSLLPQENEMLVERFLNEHAEFSPMPLKPSFDKYKVDLPGLRNEDFQYQLLPSVHGTDGFFIAKLTRR